MFAHVFGILNDLQGLGELTKKHGIMLVEVRGEPINSIKESKLCVHSLLIATSLCLSHTFFPF